MSPLLARSKHVVYTNVVEALLRFVLVYKGSCCCTRPRSSWAARRVMLSARTDTGKTGTILRLLREHRGRFLSDDMTSSTPGDARASPSR